MPPNPGDGLGEQRPHRRFPGGGAACAGQRARRLLGQSDSSQHVNFTGTDGHVHELYIPPPRRGLGEQRRHRVRRRRRAAGRLDGAGRLLGQSDSSQHVNYVGTDGHVHELYIHPGAGWVNNDLTDVVQASVTQTLLSISGVSSSDLSPIVAFELDFVGYDKGQSTTLSSGAGTISYHSGELDDGGERGAGVLRVRRGHRGDPNTATAIADRIEHELRADVEHRVGDDRGVQVQRADEDQPEGRALRRSFSSSRAEPPDVSAPPNAPCRRCARAGLRPARRPAHSAKAFGGRAWCLGGPRDVSAYMGHAAMLPMCADIPTAACPNEARSVHQ